MHKNIIQWYVVQETHVKSKVTKELKVKRWKNIFNTNNNQNWAGVVILILDKIDFIPKKVSKDKHGHHLFLKCAIQQEDKTVHLHTS